MKKIIVEVYSNPDAKRLQTPKRYVIDSKSEVTVGRSYESDIILDDPYTSKDHLKIIAHNGYFIIEDLGSKNGTFIDKTCVKGSSVKVMSGGSFNAARTKISVYEANHEVVKTKKLKWSNTVGRALNRPALAIIIFAISICFSVFTDWLFSTSDNYWGDEAIKTVLSIAAILVSASFLISIVNFLKYHRAKFLLTISFMSLLFLAIALIELISNYVSFIFLDHIWQTSVFAIIYSIICGAIILLFSYIEKGKTTRMAWATSIGLIMLIFMSSFASSIFPSFSMHLYPEYESSLPVHAWTPSNPIEINDFIEGSDSIF